MPNCRENARVNPSCESNTKSSATVKTASPPSRSLSAALLSLAARMYSNGVRPVSARNSRALWYGEYPAARDSAFSVIGSSRFASMCACIRATASRCSRSSMFPPRFPASARIVAEVPNGFLTAVAKQAEAGKSPNLR